MNPFYPNDQSIPDLVIDPCGACGSSTVPTRFNTPLRTWYIFKRAKRALTQHRLQSKYTHRLKVCHLNRANRYKVTILAQLRKPQKKQDRSQIMECYIAYQLYHSKYPTELTSIRVTPRLKQITELHYQHANKQTDIWDGDMTQVQITLTDIHTDHT